MIIAILPGQLSQTQLLILIFLVLSLDILIVALGVAGAFFFTAFKAGKNVQHMADKTVDYVVFTVLRLLEDALESPPFDKVSALQPALLGVKRAYDLYSSAQGLVVAAINAVVTLVAIALCFLFVASLVILNLAALVAVVHYAA